MDIEEAILQRRSVRKFSKLAPAEAKVREALELCRWSPSWANTQCWNVFVVSGSALDRIREAYRVRAESKAERCFDVAPHKPDWPAHLRARTEQLVQARQATGSVPAASHAFFDAPYVIFLAIDDILQAEYACLDIGLFAQSLCLTAHAKGLATCIMAMAVGWPDVLREQIPEARGLRFVLGIALGLADDQDPINHFARQRAATEEFVRWVH